MLASCTPRWSIEAARQQDRTQIIFMDYRAATSPLVCSSGPFRSPRVHFDSPSSLARKYQRELSLSTVAQDALAARHRRSIDESRKHGGSPREASSGSRDGKGDPLASRRLAHYSSKHKNKRTSLDNLQLFLTCQWSPTIGWRSSPYLLLPSTSALSLSPP